MEILLRCLYQENFAFQYYEDMQLIAEKLVDKNEINRTLTHWLDEIRKGKIDAPFRKAEPAIYLATKIMDWKDIFREMEERLRKKKGIIRKNLGYATMTSFEIHIQKCTIRTNMIKLFCGCKLFFEKQYELCKTHQNARKKMREKYFYVILMKDQEEHFHMELNGVTAMSINPRFKQGQPIINVCFHFHNDYIHKHVIKIYGDDKYEVCMTMCGCIFVILKQEEVMQILGEIHYTKPKSAWILERHDHLMCNYTLPPETREEIITILFQSKNVPDVVKKILITNI